MKRGLETFLFELNLRLINFQIKYASHYDNEKTQLKVRRLLKLDKINLRVQKSHVSSSAPVEAKWKSSSQHLNEPSEQTTTEWVFICNNDDDAIWLVNGKWPYGNQVSWKLRLTSAVELIALTSSGLRTWNLNLGFVCLVCRIELWIFFH